MYFAYLMKFLVQYGQISIALLYLNTVHYVTLKK